jgi:putative DNA primase/helicase
MTAAELLRQHGIKLTDTKPGQHKTVCPQCSTKRKKSSDPCLGVAIEPDDRVVWHCNHCNWSGPPRGSGGQGLTTYIYRDPQGVVRFRKVRNLPGREPRFWLQQPDGKGGWKKGTKGVDTTIIYRADEVQSAIAAGRPVSVVEGEKDADNLWRIGVAATCNAHGASEPGKKPKWSDKHSAQLAGADLVVLNDHDPAGHEHADEICKLSRSTAKRVRRLDLAVHWPDIPKGGDVSDWLAIGGEHTPGKLKELIAAAPDYAAGDKPKAAAGDATPGEVPPNDDAELERLARMSVLDYARARKDAAKRLGVTLSFLDTARQGKRGALGLKGGDETQGDELEFPEPEPWGEPIDGAALLAEINRYIILPERSAHAAALWVVHTYLLDHFDISPRLTIRSPTPRCGKSTFLRVLTGLVLRPLRASSVTPSIVFRVIQQHRPTFLLDEADTFFKDDEALRGVLDSGYEAGDVFMRNVSVGDNFRPRGFRTYGACAIAVIGTLHRTLIDRSIVIDLQRRLKNETIEHFRRKGAAADLKVIAGKIARWVADHGEAVGAIEASPLEALDDRANDKWEPFFAIAAVAGGPWPERAQAAALGGKVDDDDDIGSRSLLILADIRDIFSAAADDKISSANLIEKLCAIAEHPWNEYGRSGKPISQMQLSGELKRWRIKSREVRIGESTLRGYLKSQFVDAWTRYLPAPPSEVQRRNSDEQSTAYDLFQGATESRALHPDFGNKSLNSKDCCGVEPCVGGTEDKGLSARSIDTLAGWFEQTRYERREEPGIDAWLDRELCRRLREEYGVLAEFIEAEAKRVIAAVFRISDARTRQSFK